MMLIIFWAAVEIFGPMRTCVEECKEWKDVSGAPVRIGGSCI